MVALRVAQRHDGWRRKGCAFKRLHKSRSSNVLALRSQRLGKGHGVSGTVTIVTRYNRTGLETWEIGRVQFEVLSQPRNPRVRIAIGGREVVERGRTIF